MTRILVSPETLLVLRLLYVLIASAGVSMSAYVGWDCHRDLMARRRQNVNGELTRIARVNRRDAWLVNGPLHTAFLVLGVFSLMSHTASNVIGAAEAFAIIFGAVQGSAVLVQVRNQLDRASLRRRPKPTPPTS